MQFVKCAHTTTPHPSSAPSQSTGDLTVTPLVDKYDRVRGQLQNALRSLDDFIAFMNERVSLEDSISKALSKTTRNGG